MAETARTHTDHGLTIDRRNMAYALDGGVGERARIGLIALATDLNIEHEFHQVLKRTDGVALYVNRIYNGSDISPETLAAMESGITDSVALIVPQIALDVVAYGCTSGTLVIGAQTVHERIHAARANVACTTPMEAVYAALNALNAQRICFLPPYRDDINRSMRDALIANGFQVPVMGSWNLTEDDKVGRLSPDTLRDAILDLGAQPEVDAVFAACTNVRVAALAQELEGVLDKPVISSNLATIWHCLRLAGYNDPIDGFGRLFRTR